MSKNSKANRLRKKQKLTKLATVKKEKQRQKMNTIPNIYLDESGNTGSNLLDDDQPMFTLASCQLSDDDAKKLIGLVGSNAQHELHFKRLKRNKAGQDGIVRLIGSKLINPSAVKINLFHKRFMIVSKIVDTLIEHMLYLRGEDLYINGQNIALSNMLYCCLTVFCDDDKVDKMMSAFIIMLKNKDSESIEAFYSSVEDVQSSSTHVPFRTDIQQILDTKEIINDALNGIDKTTLDPSIPALFAQCIQWGKDYPKGFHLMHDDSQTLEKQADMFALFMDWTQENVEVGYDRRKYELPLKGKSLKFVDSKAHPQIQIADILASGFAYWAAGIARGEKEDYLFLELDKLNLDRFIGHNKIWPTLDVDPKDLGTVHDGGINAANYTPIFLARAKPNPEVVQ
ncbi:DUF3800 domain-containing protein [Vibrio sp. A2-1]|uniref:DUF3800 domain-containing protein n=1 Tax=Vibrio sp. A2-1 TaxID=2912252 RepID=UPI001F2D0DB4|nr:DUF3800 domain-containing protein [Vibrio sp. A2-1]MCF7486255.1 DUF3800 domain-containing protein [Vibrio sp. A2-1]